MSIHTAGHIVSLSTLDLASNDHILDEISDRPLFPINLEETKTLTKHLLMSSLPAVMASLASNVNAMVCLKFIASENNPEMLAGASLANTWATAFCIGIALSIYLGFTVFASQAYGAAQYRRFGILYQRNLLVLGIVGIPLLMSLFFAETVLAWMGLDREVSMYVGIYLRYLTPALIGLCLQESMKSFFMAQNIFAIAGIVQVSCSILNFVWCYTLVSVLGLSIRGVAMAKSITDLSGATALILYAKYSGRCTQTWIPWTKEAIEDWIGYLKAAVIIGANLYVEYLAYEASIFIAGALNNSFILGAHGLAISLQMVIFTVCSGNGVAMQAYIGNAVGGGYKNKAQKITFIAFCVNAFYVMINSVILLFYCDEVASFFTEEKETQRILSDMLFYYGLVHAADSYATHIGTVLRSIGKETLVLRIFLIYCFITLNGEWIFGLALGYSYQGIWLSMVFGMFCMFGMFVFEIQRFDWAKNVEKIKMELEGKGRQGPDYIEMQHSPHHSFLDIHVQETEYRTYH